MPAAICGHANAVLFIGKPSFRGATPAMPRLAMRNRRPLLVFEDIRFVRLHQRLQKLKNVYDNRLTLDGFQKWYKTYKNLQSN